MVDAATVGYLLAWDPKEQKEVWRAQYKRPWSGGVLSTDGNLVFQGTSDGRFVAYAADSGDLLWSVDTGQGIVAHLQSLTRLMASNTSLSKLAMAVPMRLLAD